MFVQVIEGQVADRDRLIDQFDRWLSDLKPGATGYLGTTGGITDDGRVFVVARFDSEQAARANSDRPEQAEWWGATAECFDGDAIFTDSNDVQEFLGGGSDSAGFVQVMKSADVDRAAVDAMDRAFERHAASVRPDLLGGLRVWTGPRRCIDVAYFTSEADARQNESQPPPAELAELFEQYSETMSSTEYIDLRNPILASA